MASFQHLQTRNELADYLTVPRKVLSHVLYIKKIENSYTSFEIPKRSGGTRTICVPDAELMGIQKKLALKLQQYRSKLWSDAGVSPNISHAFEKKKSIFTNEKSIEISVTY